jgi:hypothetical protein
MIVRTALFIIAGLMLGSCCMSGNCYLPMTSAPTTGPAMANSSMPGGPAGGSPMAATAGTVGSGPDGLGPEPTDEPEADVPAKPRKTAQRRKDFAAEPIFDTSASSRKRSTEAAYEKQQAADLADEERLKRKLIICKNCASSGN